jgi:hypothetical protein
VTTWLGSDHAASTRKYLESKVLSKMKTKLKSGDTVRVVGERGTAKIRAILTSMHGALLDRQIDGFRRWNRDELRLVKRKSNQRR